MSDSTSDSTPDLTLSSKPELAETATNAKHDANSSPISLWIHGSSGRMGQEIWKLAQSGPGFHLLGGSARKFEGTHSYRDKQVNKSELLKAFKELFHRKPTHGQDRIPAHLILDFSTTEANLLLLETLSDYSKVVEPTSPPLAVLIGTTGLATSTLQRWETLSRETKHLRILLAPNTSVGILTLVKAAMVATQQVIGLGGETGFDIEIVETHHKFKKDAPSGTAKFIAESLLEQLPHHRCVFNRDGARQDFEIGMHAVRGGAVFGEHEVRLIGEAEEVTISHRAFSRTLFAKGALVLGRWLTTQKPGFYHLKDVN